MSSADVSGLLRELGLRPGLVKFERSRLYDIGIVIGQDPAPGALVPRGTSIELTVSNGMLR